MCAPFVFSQCSDNDFSSEQHLHLHREDMSRMPPTGRSGTSKLAALAEAIRNLGDQASRLESQLLVSHGDFDIDVSSKLLILCCISLTASFEGSSCRHSSHRPTSRSNTELRETHCSTSSGDPLHDLPRAT